jgi:hypothetical protein
MGYATMKLRRFCFVPVIMFLMSVIISPCLAQSLPSTNGRVEYVENEYLKLGVDLSLGGAVTVLIDKQRDERNLINSHDWGRQVQMSFYSGPKPYIPPNGQQPNERWAQLGWNPIQSGDVGGHRSQLLEYENDGEAIYVRCVPMHWPHVNVPGECTFESTYRLNGNAVEATCVLNNARPDETQYQGQSQELPAVYTNGPWYKLVTYVGDRPFEDEPLSVLVDKDDDRGWPWLHYYAPEHWAALVDDEDVGLGVYQPASSDFLGGFHGGDESKGQGGEKNGQTGYISPLSQEVLDHNIRYEYEYALIAGSLDDIRQYAYERNDEREDAGHPRYVFESDRSQWILRRTTDAGWPIEGELAASLNPGAPSEWIGPKTFWRAENAPRLEIEAAFEPASETSVAAPLALNVQLTPFAPSDLKHSLHWGGPPASNPPRIRVPLTLSPNGEYRVHSIDLTKIEGYEGGMTRIRLAVPPGTGILKVRRIEFLGP